jgi:hypothetical protein
MTTMTEEITNYLRWMEMHNYARTTIGNRRRYLGYFLAFSRARDIDDPVLVTFECLLAYRNNCSTIESEMVSPCPSGPRCSASSR